MEKKIKIGILGFNTTQLFHPRSKTPFGGSETQLFLFVNELKKDKKFNIAFITRADNETPPKEHFSDNLEIITINNYTL